MWRILWKARKAVVDAFGVLLDELTEDAAEEAARRLRKQLPHHDIEVRRVGPAPAPSSPRPRPRTPAKRRR